MSIFWRVLIAVVVVLLTYAIIPPVASVLQITISGAVWAIIRIVIAAAALWYIFWGPPITIRR